MAAVPQPLLDESHRQLQEAWSYFARSLPGGSVSRDRGLLITDGQSPLPYMNMAFLTEPVRDVDDLAGRIDQAATYFRQQGLHWMFTASDDLLASLPLDAVTATAAAAGLQYMMPMEGMVASALRPPVRPLPPLDLRPVTDEETRRAVSDINGAGYDVPGDLMHTAVGVADLWTEMRGRVGYADGDPASTASVLPIDGTAYVALVATSPQHQKRGYAEAVMRRALDDAREAWGCERTVLHATPAGRPVYTRMGYDDIVTYHVYVGE